ncbi:MAG: hypothetical protein NZM00_06220 [Anaerolinea sp.]|nr:hypothetical protein [Anaerolinea sp.]
MVASAEAVAMGLDLRPHLAAIARRDWTPADDLRTTALRLNAAAGLVVRTAHDIPVTLPGVVLVPDPPSGDEDDAPDSDVSLVIHRRDPLATALEVETRMINGQRVALVDARYPDRGDPELMQALLASTVYIGNLAAYDVDLERALLTVMTPLRDGQAFRQTIAYSVLYWWAWRGIVRDELARRFGTRLSPVQIPRAETQARSRLGAYLLSLHRRGLRHHLQSIAFPGGDLDHMTFTLQLAR